MSSTNYESVFIAAPTLNDEAVGQLVETFQEIITANGGTIINTDRWGRRKLAYEIERFKEGNYTLFEFEGDGDTIRELERRYRLTDSVIRYLTVRVDRKARLVAKGTAKKKKKEARKRARGKTESNVNEARS